jgi:hypothetical protein
MKPEDFPPFCVGNVVRIHNMKVEAYNGFITGKVFEAASITVIPGTVKDPMRPVSTASKLSFSEFDQSKVEELRQWWKDLHPLNRDVFMVSKSKDLKLSSHRETNYNILGIIIHSTSYFERSAIMKQFYSINIII